MDFASILACLEDPIKRNEYIARLKSAGQNSQSVLDLKNSMEALKMHKPPKNIFETTMLQHTFKFCDPLECFLQFRLVCKPWKNAIETIRFDESNEIEILKKYSTHPNFLSKYLKVFKKFKIRSYVLPQNIQWDILGPLIVNNTHKLNEFSCIGFDKLNEAPKTYFDQILQNSNKTLITISRSIFPYPNISFPNLARINLSLHDYSEEFKATFPQLLKNCENLELVRFCLQTYSVVLCEHIGKNYPKHCISCSDMNYVSTVLQYFPLKIATNIQDLDCLDQKKYSNELEYISIIADADGLMIDGWDRYQEIFDQYNKLKQIAFTFLTFDHEAEDVEEMKFSDLKREKFSLWNERMDYFKKRGIEIVDSNQIDENEILQAKVAKEIGVKWRFDFW